VGDVSFFLSRRLETSSTRLWELLEEGGATSWPLLERLERPEVGQPVRFTLPHPQGGTLQATGRVSAVSPGTSIALAQETPWRGKIRFSLREDGDATVVRIDVSLSPSCLDWFLAPHATHPRGADQGVNPTVVKVGLLLPLSGVTGLLGRSVVNAVELAISELNRHDSPPSFELVVGDDQSSPSAAAREAHRLVHVEGCQVVVTNLSSASFDRIAASAEAWSIPLLSSSVSEHGAQGRFIFHFGETPQDQLATSIPALMESTGHRRWYLIGNDYVWPREMSVVARDVIAHHGGIVAGELFVPIETTDFSEILDHIANSGADLLLSSLIGIDAIEFEQQFYRAGLRHRIRTLATNIDDTVRELIGAAAASGIWSVQDYFMLPDDSDSDVAARYRSAFGVSAPQLTSMAKTAYEATHLYARAVSLAGTTSPSAVVDVLRSDALGDSRLLQRARSVHIPAGVAEATLTGFSRVATAHE